MSIRGAYGTKSALTIPKTIGERLRCIRMAWGWSQERLAKALGSNQRVVSHWEQGKVKPSGAAMTTLSNLLGITAEALLTGKGFTIPDMPAQVEGVSKEAVAQYSALAGQLPASKKGKVVLVDLDAFESKPLSLDEAVNAMKGTKQEVWVVVRSRKESETK